MSGSVSGLPQPGVPDVDSFPSRLRSPAVASRVGIWLGACFAAAFVTGIISHWAQTPDPWLAFPTRPVWGYRLTQGLHVATGVAAVPLLLVKLWTVFPHLFARPPARARALLLHGLERLSIGVLVAAAVFQLATGLANAAQWYPWSFSFRSSHHAVAWLAIGALAVHIGVKLPLIRQSLGVPLESGLLDRDSTSRQETALSRRGLLGATGVASALAVLTTAGGTVPWLRRVSVFASRTGEGPGGVPVNKTAHAAGVTASAADPAYRLTVVGPGGEVQLSRDDLERLPQHTARLPIACVEGWSASASWTGVRVRDLLDLVEAEREASVLVVSLQESGPFRRTLLPGHFAADDLTLLALDLAGEPLDPDHGYPCRLIAPNRPGVLQTKWVSRLEVLT